MELPFVCKHKTHIKFVTIIYARRKEIKLMKKKV